MMLIYLNVFLEKSFFLILLKNGQKQKHAALCMHTVACVGYIEQLLYK